LGGQRQIGNGAEAYAHNNIKKHEQLPLKLSMLNPIYFLMYATGEKMNITQIEGQFPQAPFPKREQRGSSSRIGSRFPTKSSNSIFWTGNCVEKIPSPITRRRKCAATSSTGRSDALHR
jgi:hypothetical protein